MHEGGALAVDRGLSELSDALVAIAKSPDDPAVEPGALLRLMLLMRTLDEPDEIAGAA